MNLTYFLQEKKIETMKPFPYLIPCFVCGCNDSIFLFNSACCLYNILLSPLKVLFVCHFLAPLTLFENCIKKKKKNTYLGHLGGLVSQLSLQL